MKLDKHGLKMHGVRKASGETVEWNSRSGGHTQISYNVVSGEVYTNDHIGNNWSRYHDPNIITVCHTSHHMTMQQIADAIAVAVDNHKQWKI